MTSAFSTALSGLNANSSAIDVIGNDLANLNTTGYKANQLHFSDLLSQQIGSPGSGGQIGMGVGEISNSAVYTQGNLQATGGPTDVAIQGNGFFVVKDQNNQTLYTRDGSFSVGTTGNLVDSNGDTVQGWSSASGNVNPNGPVGNISVPLGSTIAATATTNMSVALNLDSRVTVGGTGGTFTAPMQVVDSQGNTHTLTASFTKTGANTWGYSLSIPPSELTSGSTTPLVTGTLTFDANGNLSSPAVGGDPHTVTIAGLKNGAADMSIGWDFYGAGGGAGNFTQYAEAAGVSGSVQNGFAAGQLNDVSLQAGGMLVASYSNGQKLTVGQVALASISNPDTLISVGGNNLASSVTTASPTIGTAGSGPRGQIVAGSLEGSTVDIAQEFTQLLTFERGYQANSRVITTDDQLLQETVNLIHA